MNKIRTIILAAVVVLTAFLAYGLFTLPNPKGIDYDGFSSARVAEDVRVISEKPHSVEHPEERAEVRQYLIDRLQEMGGLVSTFQYDSLKSMDYVFDAVNVLAEFNPKSASEDTTYLMLVAHYDSRYEYELRGKNVLSHGAADDGYGLGVILETVSQALKSHADWKQGIKVLFTDGEEVGMVGMKAAMAEDRDVFDNVGMIINIEARGTYGPCMLFETSPGNEKIMELYADAAGYPFTYSLTTVVYRFLPNLTDFTYVKDEIPGMNFANVADINHYHTDKDKFENISERTIQHCGEQILPIIMAYLTGEKYADKDYLKSADETTNFTIPVFGLFNFGKGTYAIINVVIFVIFLLLLSLEVVRGRMKAGVALKRTAMVFAMALVSFGLGVLVTCLSGLSSGIRFKFLGVMQGVQFDNVIMLVASVVFVLLAAFVYILGRAKAKRSASSSMRSSATAAAVSKYAYGWLYGTLLLLFVLSAVLLIAFGENFMFMLPLTFATVAMILWHITNLKLFLPIGISAILLHSFSFLHTLAIAMTIGAYGAVAMIGIIHLMVIIPMADLYVSKN